ncbi:MAG TPA: peptidylprolyl isomerase [Bacteroidales bacterium]|nr:peptidylprolyl isomerase [Bacteroidales bacterium]
MKKTYSLLKCSLTLTISIIISTMANSQSTVLLQTTAGNVKIRLYDETPLHKDNFLKLVKQGYYDRVLFHRVIPDFMVQAGDPNSKTAKSGQALGDGGPSYTLPAEFVPALYHKKGAVAAARKSDEVNPRQESSGSQFYIVEGTVLSQGQLDALERSGRHPVFTPEQRTVYTTLGGTPHLDNAYTVFGEVVEGLDIVTAISLSPADQRNRPVSDIKIIKATVTD